jgi:predicted transcriptional regulator
MTLDKKQQARERTRMLLELRKEYALTVENAQDLLKKQQAARKLIEKVLQDGSHSVPQLAQQTGIPAHEVLWHVASMKKYGVIMETGADESGDYFAYALNKEAKS